MLPTPCALRFNVIYIHNVFNNITLKFSSDYLMHGIFYPDYSEKINLKRYGLLYNSDAPLQTPKPGQSLVNIKFNVVRKGESNKVTLGQHRKGGHPPQISLMIVCPGRCRQSPLDKTDHLGCFAEYLR